MPGAWSRTSTVRKARNTGDSPGGFRLKYDPTLPSTSRAVVDGKGKRQGVVNKVGGKWTHSKDNHKKTFSSPHAALRQFASGSSGGQSDGGSGDSGGKDG